MLILDTITKDAVVDVDMEVNPGDYLCIVGENGSGKSTLMKGLLGLLKPTAGRLTVSDELKGSGNRIPAPADGCPEGFSGHGAGGSVKRMPQQAGWKPFIPGLKRRLQERTWRSWASPP